jgi:tetratricopeptide (TPR) repeat protein
VCGSRILPTGGRDVAEQPVTSGYLKEIDQAGSVPPGLQDFFAKAEEAVMKRNYPYAIAMYRRIVTAMPGNLWVRRRLRGTELKVLQEGQSANPIVGTIVGLPALLQIGLATLAFRRVAAINACEAFLARVPSSAAVLRVLAGHAQKLKLLETAIFSLESAHELNKNHIRTLVWLASLYEQTNRMEKAVQCLQVASGLRPNDRELLKRLNDTTARRTIQKAGLDREGDFRKSLVDEEASVELDREHRVEKTEDDLQRNIRKAKAEAEASPGDVNAVRRLAAAYRAAEQWDEAYAWYQRAAEIDTKDYQLKVMMGDMRRAKYRQVIREGEEAVAQRPDDAALRDRLDRLRKEFADFELEEFRRRVEAYPTNLDLKFEYGMRLFERGDLLHAVQQFQRSVRDPKRTRHSRTMLGRCFLGQNLPQFAKEQFAEALAQKEVLDDEEALDLYYHLAEAQEALGDYAGALDSYGKIYTVDVMFRDIQARMERARRKAKETPAAETGAGAS